MAGRALLVVTGGERAPAFAAPHLPLPAKLLALAALSHAGVHLFRLLLAAGENRWLALYGATFYTLVVVGAMVAALGAVGLLARRAWGRWALMVGVCVKMGAAALLDVFRLLGWCDSFRRAAGSSLAFIVLAAGQIVLVVAYLRDDSVREATGARCSEGVPAPERAGAVPLLGEDEPPMARPGLPFAAKAVALYAFAEVVFWGLSLAIMMRRGSNPFAWLPVGEWGQMLLLGSRSVHLILLAYGGGVFLARERMGRRLLIVGFCIGYAAWVLQIGLTFYFEAARGGEGRYDFLFDAVVTQLFWTGFLVSYLREERVKRALRY